MTLSVRKGRDVGFETGKKLIETKCDQIRAIEELELVMVVRRSRYEVVEVYWYCPLVVLGKGRLVVSISSKSGLGRGGGDRHRNSEIAADLSRYQPLSRVNRSVVDAGVVAI